jgi:predicted dehydrogenase
VLSVFHNRRWDGDFLAAQALIANGSLGEVLHFESHIDRFRPEVRQRWREQAVPGGGIWYDLGPHLIDQALVLFGLPEKVSGHLAQQRPGAQTDDWAHVLLDYGQLKVVLHASMMVAHSGPRYTIHGTGGTWIKTGMDVQEGQLVQGMVPGAEGWGVDSKPGLFYNGVDPDPKKLGVPPGDYRQFYVRMKAAIREGQPNPVPPGQAIAVMAVIETALASARSGQALEVALTDEERTAYAESRASLVGS